MDPILLDPTEVSATWTDGRLTITASGRQDGVRDIAVVPDPVIPIEPPVFRVQGRPTPAIGNFPYEVHGVFPMATDPGRIQLETPSGTRMVPVGVASEV